MESPVLSVLGLTFALVIAEALRGASTPVAAAVLVGVGALAAALANRVGPLAIATGALAAVAWVVLRPMTPALAGAGFVVLAVSARALRMASAPLTVLHTGVSLTSGGVAAWAIHRWVPHGLSVDQALSQIAALVIASLTLSVPFLLHSEDPETHALLRLAKRSRGPARWRLLRAVVLRRRALSQLTLRPDERKALRRAFSDLDATATQLLDAGTSMRGVAEGLRERVTAIGRAVRAMALAEEEERHLEGRASDAVELQKHAEARREVLRALS